MTTKLSESEMTALQNLAIEQSILISKVPDKNIHDHLSRLIVGMTTYNKLIKKGFCFITEEDEILLDDGEPFSFTPSIELTEEGMSLIKQLNVESYNS